MTKLSESRIAAVDRAIRSAEGEDREKLLEVVNAAVKDTEPPLPYPKTLRQSTIAAFDQCPKTTLFKLQSQARQSPGSMGLMAARGTLFHRFAATAILWMREHTEGSIPVEVAMELLTEIIAQRDVDERDVVHLTMRELRWLRVLVTKWAYQHSFSIERLVAVERRLSAEITVVGANGERYIRTITGQPDVLLAGPGPDEATVVDWKAQPLDARVLTPTGWRLMGELSVGDRVVGSDGRPTEVTGVYPQGRKEVFEVEVTDGGTTRCCDEHLWTVRKADTNGWQVRPLSDIRHDLERGARGYWRTPALSRGVAYDDVGSLPLDPYLVGALLGDGNLRATSSVRFTTADPEIIERIEAVLPEGVTARRQGVYEYALTALRGQGNALRDGLRGIGLLGKLSPEKSVPHNYLRAPIADRLALLRGLMDTDGYVSERNQVSFCSSSRQLAEDVRELVWSLGGRATIKTWDKGEYRPSHAVYFRIPDCPFSLERKAARWSESKLTMSRGIRSIRSLGEMETQCIKVAAKDEIYVTDDFILTHNSGFAPPANKRESQPGEAPREDKLSDMGYVQQIVYGWLVLRNYPLIQRVTEREYYVMHGEAREATVERWEMERIEDVLAAKVSQLDAAIDAGPLSDRWIPIAGTHCGFCPRPRHCPIKDEVGIPADEAEAQQLAHEWIVSGVVRAERLPYLKGYVDAHGPIPVAHAKGRREVGYQRNKTGEGRRFVMYEPEDAADSPFDPLLEQAARDAGVLTSS